jgi:hypothetical protein
MIDAGSRESLESRSFGTGIMLVHTIGFLLMYALVTRILMPVNNAILGLSDPEIDWPILTIAFSPVTIAAIVVAWWPRLSNAKRPHLLWTSLVLIIGWVEVSFFLNIAPYKFLTAQVALVFVFILLAARARADNVVGSNHAS